MLHIVAYTALLVAVPVAYYLGRSGTLAHRISVFLSTRRHASAFRRLTHGIADNRRWTRDPSRWKPATEK